MNRTPALAAALVALALAACPGPKKEEEPPPPPPPPPPEPVLLQTFQDASVAIGHDDLVTGANALDVCDASTLFGPVGAAAFDGASLYVPDTGQNRVLAFAGIPTSSGAAASFVVGKPALDDCSFAQARDTGFPQTVRAEPAPPGGQSRLLVTDEAVNRVLLYFPAPTASDPTPSVIVGQTAIDGSSAGLTASTLNQPYGAFIAGDRLLVADAFNNRVLVWDALPTSNGAAANLVLGQADFVSGDPNRGATPDADTLDFPTEVWSDGERVVVADSGNHRVLVWSSFPTQSGAAATAVIGQASFTSATAAAGDKGLRSPQSVTSDGTQLFVADTGNHRVLVYPSIPTTGSGAAATVVLGQFDFANVTPNDANHDGTIDDNPSAATLDTPTGIAVIDQALFVTDTGNDRVLVFRPPAP